MRRLLEANDPKSCWNKAHPNELVFVLLGRDEAAAETIRCWVGARLRLGLNGRRDLQIQEALALADEIERSLSTTRDRSEINISPGIDEKALPQLRKLIDKRERTLMGFVEPEEGAGERFGRNAIIQSQKAEKQAMEQMTELSEKEKSEDEKIHYLGVKDEYGNW